ncbi:MAG TPA: hypothetical protein ENI85_19615 [Deltaproteobacteria bacterium]|nr:hypothetical protein [Deltaproteobacteria bacterium]
MIRLCYYLRRKPEVSLEDFQDQWLRSHAPLVARHASALRIRRYIQSHTRPEDPVGQALQQTYGVGGEPYDGVAELWWKSPRDLEEATKTPEGQAAARELVEDERRILDFSRSALWFAVDMPQISPPGRVIAREETTLLKGFYVGRLARGLDPERAKSHWLSVHGALARQYEQFLPFERYIQVHRAHDELAVVQRAAREGMGDFPSIGHAETWIDRRVMDTPPGPEAQEAFALLVQDIGSFVDTSASSMFVAKEHVILDEKIFTPPLPTPAD